MSGKHVDTLYVVTGISRLTGEREAVSRPKPPMEAMMLRNKWKKVPASKRVYTHLKVEPFTLPCFPEE